jgi:hypothetical protein
MTRKWTIGILIAIAVILIAWDVYVYVEPSDGDTISEVTLAAAGKHPVIPFAIGVICGHLFWPQRSNDE